MKEIGKKSYSEEFKKEAISLAEKVGRKQAAIDLGVSQDSIRRWMVSASALADAEIGSPRDLEAENKRLKKEIEYLRLINEVLKKSTAIFSRDQIGNFK